MSILSMSSFETFGWYTLVLSVVVIVLGGLYLVIESRITKNECQKRKLKHVSVPNQMFSTMFGDRYDLVESRLVQKHGTVFGCSFWNKFCIYIADPELVQIVCNREFTKFANRREFQSMDPIFDKMLFMVNNADWKRLRAIMTPTFSTGKLKKIKFVVDETCQNLLKNFDSKIAENGVVNIKDCVGAFTMDTIVQMAFGVKVDSLTEKNNPIITTVKKMFSTDITFKDILIVIIMQTQPKLFKILGLRLNGDVIDFFAKMSQDIIKKKRQEFKNRENPSKAKNFIELLLEASESDHQANGKHHENGETPSNQPDRLASNNTSNGALNGLTVPESKNFKHISDDEIIAQCVLFFMVGYDTTATLITNVCYCLATNPEVQEKLYQEIAVMLNRLSEEHKTNDPYELVNFETLHKFEYLSAVVNEALRLYSPAPTTEREATENVQIESDDGKIRFNVHKGDIIRMPVKEIHLNEKNFEEPHKFKPERFLNPDEFNKYAFMPFGTGPRNCIAKNLALLEAKMALLHMIRSYKLSVSPTKTKIPIEFYFNADIMICKDIHLRMEKR